MDQFASLFGEAGKVIRLDCRSLEYKLEPFDPERMPGRTVRHTGEAYARLFGIQRASGTV